MEIVKKIMVTMVLTTLSSLQLYAGGVESITSSAPKPPATPRPSTTGPARRPPTARPTAEPTPTAAPGIAESDALQQVVTTLESQANALTDAITQLQKNGLQGNAQVADLQKQIAAEQAKTKDLEAQRAKDAASLAKFQSDLKAALAAAQAAAQADERQDAEDQALAGRVAKVNQKLNDATATVNKLMPTAGNPPTSLNDMPD